MAFTALATRAYKDPLTTVYLNSIKQNDDFLITGVAKAFVSFDGTSTGPTGTTGQNVATVTRTQLAVYRVTFTTGFSSNKYIPYGIAYDLGSYVRINGHASGIATALSTTSCMFSTINDVNAQVDSDRVSVAFLGTLA